MQAIENRVLRLERCRPSSTDLSRMTDAELMAELRSIDPDEATRTERMLAMVRGDGPLEEVTAWARDLGDLRR